MSQHKFQVNNTTECMVGWDPALDTFFGQVYTTDAEGERVDGEDGEPSIILWVGTKSGEIRTVDELEHKLQPHATMPDSVREELYAIEVD